MSLIPLNQGERGYISEAIYQKVMNFVFDYATEASRLPTTDG